MRYLAVLLDMPLQGVAGMRVTDVHTAVLLACSVTHSSRRSEQRFLWICDCLSRQLDAKAAPSTGLAQDPCKENCKVEFLSGGWSTASLH